MKSFPWDAIATSKGEDGFPIYDRSYSAEDWRKVYETFFSNGVFVNEANAFVVTADEGMNVMVSPGTCCIKGTIGWEPLTRTMALQAPSDQDRIDTVVLRWNANVEERKIDMYVKQGTPAAVPVQPSLTRNNTVYELGIADVFVSKSDDSISQQRISDTRLNTARCGAVTALLNVDTTTFFNQIQDAVDRAVELANAALSGTIPGELQAQIDEIVRDYATKEYASNASNLSSGNLNIARIADSSITGAKIANGTITGGKLASGTVASGNIASGAISSDKLDTTLKGTTIQSAAGSSANITLTALSGITITGYNVRTYGPLRIISLNFTKSTQTAANTNVSVCTMNNAGTVIVRGIGSSSTGIAWIDGAAAFHYMPMFAVNANTELYAQYIVLCG